MHELVSYVNVNHIHFARKTGSVRTYIITDPQCTNESNLFSFTNQFKTGDYLSCMNEVQKACPI